MAAARMSTLEPLTLGNKSLRLLWHAVWLLLFRPSPVFAHGWRRALLRAFGARIDPTAVPYPSVRIWAPWNLSMAKGSCLAPDVDCYCVATVSLHENAIVSQYSYLCTASHDYSRPDFPLVASPIVVGASAWVCASAFIGPGVHIGEGAIVGACGAVFKDVEAWTIVGGNPARYIKARPR